MREKKNLTLLLSKEWSKSDPRDGRADAGVRTLSRNRWSALGWLTLNGEDLFLKLVLNGLKSFKVVHSKHVIFSWLRRNGIKLLARFPTGEGISHLLPKSRSQIIYSLLVAVSFSNENPR